jgi:hypothetical protein
MLSGSLPRVKLLARAAASPGNPVTFPPLGAELLWQSIANWTPRPQDPRWLADARVAACERDGLIQGATEWNLYDLHAWVPMPNHAHVLIKPLVPLPRAAMLLKRLGSPRQ